MKAMILAAGRGERMRPLTDLTPKPLLEVRGKPLIAWHIEKLARAGFDAVVINLAHLGHMIEAAFGDGAGFGISIRYSRERGALETAGGIAQALPLIGDVPFAVINADIYCEYDFQALRAKIEAWQRMPVAPLAHLVLVDNPEHHAAGDFALRDDLVNDATQPKLTFSGIGVYQAALFASVTRGERAQLAPLLRQAMLRQEVTGEHFHGFWTDVGTPQRLAELNAML
jgi:N-acetyl-alpha-D-muramate 1-phosphate uridylyltransferase